MNIELFSANAYDCELVDCELIVFVIEHKLSWIDHELCHELNLWVIYGQFMEIRVYVKLEH